jgi:hypothetical protein
VESLDIAYAAQENLEHDCEVTVWTQGIFDLSKFTIESLVEALDEFDFALFVFAPDDIAKIRGSEVQTVRDNVIFELGLFVGRIGRERSFIIVPRGADDLRIPTDLLGITPAAFEPNRQDENIVAAIGPACNRMRKPIKRLDRRAQAIKDDGRETNEDFGISVDECQRIEAPFRDENSGKVRCRCQIRGTYVSKPPEERLVLVHRNRDEEQNWILKPIDIAFNPSSKTWEITYWQGGTGVKPVYLYLAGTTGQTLIRYYRSIVRDGAREPVTGDLGSDFLELGSGEVEIEASC